MLYEKSLRQAVLVLAGMALLITACSPGAAPTSTVDVNAILTAAVETAMGQFSAQLTQTALAAPSATSLPTILLCRFLRLPFPPRVPGHR